MARRPCCYRYNGPSTSFGASPGYVLPGLAGAHAGEPSVPAAAALRQYAARGGMIRGSGGGEGRAVEAFDPTKPNIARVWDYWLGGKDNFAADRELAERMLEIHPVSAQMARENRQFLGRAVRYVAEQGVSQFIDIGACLPTALNTHDIARRVNPNAKVAYVDNDPV